jgi:hypothetical protein
MHGIHPRLIAAVATTLVALPATAAQADVWGTTFESPAYSAGDIDTQGDWTNAGGYDANVASVSSFADAAGYGFGTKALQISNAKTSGSFTDQTYTPRLIDEAGEADAVGNGISGGIRRPHFEARFRLGTTKATQQPGNLQLRVSPDRGEGGRMTYLRFEDQADGVHVIFKDLPDGTLTGGHVNFVDTDVATLSRASSHLIEYSIDLKDGPDNDVVRVLVDGTVVATGHTWEEYYRHDTEQAGNGNEVPTISALGFVQSGPQAVGNAGQGFLIDDVRIESTSPGANPGPVGPQGAGGSQGPAGPGIAAALHEASPVVIRTKSGRVDRRGRVSIRLACPQGAGLCDGSLVLTLGRSQAGRSAFDIDGGKSKTVKVKLSRSALKALGKKKRTFRVNVLARDIQGAAARSAGNLSVRKR